MVNGDYQLIIQKTAKEMNMNRQTVRLTLTKDLNTKQNYTEKSRQQVKE
jgi:hypothetical protein